MSYDNLCYKLNSDVWITSFRCLNAGTRILFHNIQTSEWKYSDVWIRPKIAYFLAVCILIQFRSLNFFYSDVWIFITAIFLKSHFFSPKRNIFKINGCTCSFQYNFSSIVATLYTLQIDYRIQQTNHRIYFLHSWILIYSQTFKLHSNYLHTLIFDHFIFHISQSTSLYIIKEKIIGRLYSIDLSVLFKNTL